MVEIGLVVLEIWKAEFGNFAVPVNNTLVCRTSFFVFLAADTLLCVLINIFCSITLCLRHLSDQTGSTPKLFVQCQAATYFIFHAQAIPPIVKRISME